jgi:hypothetical protein
LRCPEAIFTISLKNLKLKLDSPEATDSVEKKTIPPVARLLLLR